MAHPDHGILGEEFESIGLDRDFVWIIDPIDGTKAFITGIPTFGTLIALAYRGRPILGVIDNPVTAERWIGGDGLPTRRNGNAVQTRKGASLPSPSWGTAILSLSTRMNAPPSKGCGATRNGASMAADAMPMAEFRTGRSTSISTAGSTHSTTARWRRSSGMQAGR